MSKKQIYPRALLVSVIFLGIAVPIVFSPERANSLFLRFAGAFVIGMSAFLILAWPLKRPKSKDDNTVAKMFARS